MEGQVQFKAYFYWKDQHNAEVRRFGVEKHFATNFSYLVVKLQKIYPALKHMRYTISWKDEEDDNVTVSSDEEMMIALSCMTDNLVRLNVHCSDTKPWTAQNNCNAVISGTSSNTSVLKPEEPKRPIPLEKTMNEMVISNQAQAQPQQLHPESSHIMLKPKEPKPKSQEKILTSRIARTVKKISSSQPKAQPQQEQPESHHMKPHIDKAIKQMLSMGFNNSDNWLTQLLETTNGDIIPVIELLTPVKAEYVDINYD